MSASGSQSGFETDVDADPNIDPDPDRQATACLWESQKRSCPKDKIQSTQDAARGEAREQHSF